MKESKLIEMSNRIETLGGVVQQLIGELNNLKNLSVGTLETVKLLPGYEEAIKQLIEKNTKKDGEENSDSAVGGSDRTFETD